MMTNQATLLKSLEIIYNHARYQEKAIAITQGAQGLHNGQWEIILSAQTLKKLNQEHTLKGSSMMKNKAPPLKSVRMMKNHVRCQGKSIATTQKAQVLNSGPWEIILPALLPQKLNLGHTLNSSRVMARKANPLKSLKIIQNYVRYQEKWIKFNGKAQVVHAS